MYSDRTYSYYEERYSVHRRRCINGKVTGSNNCCGYCEYHEHPGFLTPELVRRHRCEEKGCWYYKAKPVKLWDINLKSGTVTALWA